MICIDTHQNAWMYMCLTWVNMYVCDIKLIQLNYYSLLTPNISVFKLDFIFILMCEIFCDYLYYNKID